MSMPITKDTVESLYYKWWCELCREMTPELRKRCRRAVSVIEAYRSEFMYHVLMRRYQHDSRKEGFDKTEWKYKMVSGLTRVVENDRVKIRSLMLRSPDALICIAGVINGIRRATDVTAALNTVVLLDALCEETLSHIEKASFKDVGFLRANKSIYLPLKEPEVHSVIATVNSMLKGSQSLTEKVNKEYTKRRNLLSLVFCVREVDEDDLLVA